jgi:hypothetical protein
MRLILAILFLSILNGSCKKEMIERDSNHFMTSFPIKTNEDIRMIVEYNNNVQQVTIAGDSIIFKREGLYHFQGNIYLFVERIDAAKPVLYNVHLTVPDLGQVFRLGAGITKPYSDIFDVDFCEFTFEIYLKANSVVELSQSISNAAVTSPLIYGHFGGYRKGG